MIAIRLKKQVRCGVANLIVAGIDVQNGKIFLQGGVNFALVKQLLRFIETFGKICHSGSEPFRL